MKSVREAMVVEIERTERTKHLLEGTVEDVQQWIEVITATLDARKVKKGTESARTSETYIVPIMGNPRRPPEEVTLWVEYDSRVDRGVVKVGNGGMERLLWQARTVSLCNDCVLAVRVVGRLVCSRLLGPGKRKRECDGFRKNGMKRNNNGR